MSDTDSDSDCDLRSSTPSNPLKKALNVCLNMIPTYSTDPSASENSLLKLRDVLTKKLDDINKKLVPARRSVRTAAQKTKSDETEMLDDFAVISKKIDLIFVVLFQLFDQFDIVKIDTSKNNENIAELDSLIREVEPARSAMETRIFNLESKLSTNEISFSGEPSSPTFASTVRDVGSIPTGPRRVLSQANTDRIERLEFHSSEEERKRRLLQVTITHPNIDHKNPDSSVISDILRNHLKMERREIDANMRIAKFSRANTVLLCLSHKRFKIFLFKSRKKLRDSNPAEPNNLYLNEHLTTSNHQILMSLKKSKKLRLDEGLPTFASVYTFEGKVYVKKVINSSNIDAIFVKTLSMATEITNDYAAISLSKETSENS